MSDRDLIDEVLSEREDPEGAGSATGSSPSRSESTPRSGAGADGVVQIGGSAPKDEPPAPGTESGAADVGASRAGSPAQRPLPRVAAPDDPHFKPDFGTKLGKDRKSKKTGRSR